MRSDLQALQQLIDIMATLRSAQGCAWDRQQSPASLKPYILEECYELLEAIDQGDPGEICDELGDLLLQVVFQAQIYKEQDHFGMAEVADAISRKLIRRHPHVFADADMEGHERRWEEIKLQERREKGLSNRLGKRIPVTLPALKRAQKIIKKYDTSDISDLFFHIEDQLSELNKLANGNPKEANAADRRLGSLLFDLIRLAQNLGVDAEECLRVYSEEILTEMDRKSDQ